jgi:hypothetical protein
MIIEYNGGQTTITNNDIAHKIADAEYYCAIAMINGNTKRKKYWLREIEKLKKQIMKDE